MSTLEIVLYITIAVAFIIYVAITIVKWRKRKKSGKTQEELDEE